VAACEGSWETAAWPLQGLSTVHNRCGWRHPCAPSDRRGHGARWVVSPGFPPCPPLGGGCDQGPTVSGQATGACEFPQLLCLKLGKKKPMGAVKGSLASASRTALQSARPWPPQAPPASRSRNLPPPAKTSCSPHTRVISGNRRPPLLAVIVFALLCRGDLDTPQTSVSTAAKVA
jgi:hypothetical protein